MNITIISCTNREKSFTYKVALIYKSLLEKKGLTPDILSLTDLPSDIAFSELYGKRSQAFEVMVKNHIDNADAFILIMPEYNGSFPGILKLFLDAVHPSKWNEKKVSLTGISSGRSGNVKGMDHLTSILNYLKMHVYYNKLPISQIDKLFNGSETLSHDETLRNIDKQIEGFLKFV